MNQPFVVHVAQLRRVMGTRWEVAQDGVIDDLVCAGSRVPEGSAVHVEVVLESFPGGVVAVGTVTAPWSGTCRRCLAPTSGVLQVAVRERFVDERGAPPPAAHRPSARRGTPGREGGAGRQSAPGREDVLADEEAYPLVGDELDLEALARDAILLELPMAPVCRADCRGLCAGCGADLNVEQCPCQAPTDLRWAALDALRRLS